MGGGGGGGEEERGVRGEEVKGQGRRWVETDEGRGGEGNYTVASGTHAQPQHLRRPSLHTCTAHTGNR